MIKYLVEKSADINVTGVCLMLSLSNKLTLFVKRQRGLELSPCVGILWLRRNRKVPC